jgi:VCBS repeat protein/FG-GAP repeat protein
MRGLNRVPKAVTVLIALLSVTKTYGAAQFAPAKNYPVGTNPKAVVIADFNGDRKLDIAVANSGDPAVGDAGNVSILLGNGDGTFQPAHDVTAGKNPWSISVGDFNGDGYLDLVVANNGMNVTGGWLPGTVSVLLGNGDGSFQTHVDYPTGTGPTSVAVADFNGDSRLDLAVAAHPANVVSVLLGKGDGTFETHIDYATGNGGGNGAVALADFNRDGRVDLAMAGRFGDGIVGILVGKGDGTFQSPVGYDPAGLFGRSIAVGDFNGDGKLSLAVTFANLGNGTASGVGMLPGNGDGSFSGGSTLATASAGCHTGSPLLGDFDGDGKLDLAVIAGGGPHEGVCLFLGGGTVLVFKKNGKGVFQESSSFTTVSGQDLGAAADLDGNELPDLVILNSDNTIGVLLNSTAPDFSLNPEVTSLMLNRGGQVSDVISASAQGILSGAIALRCSIAGPAPMPTCGISPATVKPRESATLTINAAALAAELRPPTLGERGRGLGAASLPLGLLGCILATGFDKKRRKLWTMCLIVMVATVLPAACGGNGDVAKRPPSQTYTVTVSATSGTLQHSTTISVTVQ